ncbi:alpha/beta hydrolase [Streptomyces sp. SPB162]|uniref:alpha/beta hydrolase n=1 Tax=Streptomyces sp. SPB162 TaxID=2940560 RepID=UPI002406D256|nr:alpha/beta hydrolase [Streptomyces sp. SPB162]MDF9811730.1 fermentation-respiration switch protein FrsA (DUF1100 family) [Streptomyces sp. SPB162]
MRTVRTDVTFVSNGLTPTGHLHTPDFRSGHPLPAIVVIHLWGGVKEQTAGRYARRPAEAGSGFAALAFHAAHQGASEGERHFLEHPVQRAEDIKSAVSCLSTRKDVTPDRLGPLGISVSGHAVYAAMHGLHSRTTADTTSAACLGSLLRVRLGGGHDPVVFRDPVARAGLLRVAEALGEPTVPEPPRTAPAADDRGQRGLHGPRRPNGRRTRRCTDGVVLARRCVPLRPARRGRIRLPTVAEPTSFFGEHPSRHPVQDRAA